MKAINEGRWTVDLDGDFVVFLLGARVGNPLKAVKALPLLMQLPKMLADLARDPSKGLLGYQLLGRGTNIQYWRSFEDLERFARNPDDRHARVWREWYRRMQHHNPSVGIWHETYRVQAGQYEAIYGGMPAYGLGRAGSPRRIGRGRETSRERIGAEGEPTLGVPID
jgi:hypothetical protein